MNEPPDRMRLAAQNELICLCSRSGVMDAFTTKSAARAFVSAFLKPYRQRRRSECTRITDSAALMWIYDLLSRHPDWDERKGCGVEWIGVHGGHFCLVRDGGESHEDISFHKCLTPPKPRDLLLRACRCAINDQILEARENIFAGTEPVLCAMHGCGKLLKNDATTHLDHIIPFVRLFDDWLGERAPESIATRSVGTERAFAASANAEEADWCRIHAERAHLRAVCARCNLCRPRIHENS